VSETQLHHFAQYFGRYECLTGPFRLSVNPDASVPNEPRSPFFSATRSGNEHRMTPLFSLQGRRRVSGCHYRLALCQTGFETGSCL
jgi:hypothetical protein